ncbi:Metalloenzyme, LuxS/M16 peptidase-like protein [Leucosporidium creatinivorum]|uniref:Metalloenzyme, LuxS/M16 peptidase-like protein n=1 Tax=Leucosporidium creatinivorum TaxID=106004 RepID=A0A1Y2D4R7_9BASI|nr:Metalloenzyme, LuxS/M16 peptidase-like protein [Leucosporidium creatinivorum]
MITLSNGLTALLIEDPKTDKAAVAMSVGVGHLSDPDDLPGLAHFCEHMLFLGTSHYPEEASYKHYLSQNSGSSNAFTSLAETNYYLDVSPAGLPGALSRHAQFFTSPLFDPSCTEREVNAVNSEQSRNLQLDARRLFQLGKATSNREDGSRYWKFGTGNKETLWEKPKKRGVDVRDKLLEWYANNYSANIMNLVILSTHTLDELTELVLAEYSDIPNLNLEHNIFDAPVLTPAELKTEISYRTIKDTPQLRIEWPLPDLRGFWSSKPGRFIAHYVGHEGPGSILAELKKLGWATSLSASSSNGSPGFELFRININLTALGLSNYKLVLQHVFSYLSLLRSTPPQEWAFAEQQKLGQIGWRWKENGQPSPFVKGLASRMTDLEYPPERVLVGPWFAVEFDEKVIRECLERMTVEGCRVLVGSKEPLEGRAEWSEKEEYYGTEFERRPLDVEVVKAPAAADLKLPEPNMFIPSDLELVTPKPIEEPAKRPSLIRQTSSARLFFKKDDTWCVPRATAYFLLKSPLADVTAVAAIKSQIFASLVEESLASYSYDATLAGLAYSVGNEVDGLELVASGYSDKLPLLLKVVLEKLRDFEADPKQFEVVHERLTRAYKNTKQNNPSTMADSHLRHLTRQTHWTFDDRLEALEGLTPRDIEKHSKELLAELQIEGLVHGNATKESALNMLKLVETVLEAKPADPAQNDYHRALVLPTPSNLVFRPEVPSPQNINSAAGVYYEVGATTDYDQLARLHLFAQIAKVPIFSTLRTKEALGYIVSSAVWSVNQRQGFRVMVQSERTAEYLEDRIEAFWTETFEQYLEEMGEEEFEKQKESLVLSKREKAKNLGQETSRYWSEIESGELDFFHREREATLILTLTKADITTFFRTFFHPTSSSRSKLSILMRSQRLQPTALAPLLTLIQQQEPALPSERLEEARKVLEEGKPTLEDLRAAVEKAFGGDVPSLVKGEMERVAEKAQLREGTMEILEEEVESWRAGLEKGEEVKPVGDFATDLEAHL